MSSDTASPRVRAEHDSLPAYLTSVLTPQQLSNVLLISFNQWAMVFPYWPAPKSESATAVQLGAPMPSWL